MFRNVPGCSMFQILSTAKTKRPFLDGSEMFSHLKRCKEYLKPYDYRAVLFTYS